MLCQVPPSNLFLIPIRALHTLKNWLESCLGCCMATKLCCDLLQYICCCYSCCSGLCFKHQCLSCSVCFHLSNLFLIPIPALRTLENWLGSCHVRCMATKLCCDLSQYICRCCTSLTLNPLKKTGWRHARLLHDPEGCAVVSRNICILFHLALLCDGLGVGCMALSAMPYDEMLY